MRQARAFCFVCAGLLCLLPAAVGAQTRAHLYQWGSPGSGDGQFIHPYGLVVDGSGRVYVADVRTYTRPGPSASSAC
jgi:hypothetical protein